MEGLLSTGPTPSSSPTFPPISHHRRDTSVRFCAHIPSHTDWHTWLWPSTGSLTKYSQKFHPRHDDSLQHSPGGAHGLHPETGPAAGVGGLEHQGNLDNWWWAHSQTEILKVTTVTPIGEREYLILFCRKFWEVKANNVPRPFMKPFTTVSHPCVSFEVSKWMKAIRIKFCCYYFDGFFLFP